MSKDAKIMAGSVRKTGLRALVLQAQSMFGLRPRSMCLIIACPRTSSSAVARWLGSQRRAVYTSQSRILVPAYRFLREADRFKNLHAERHSLVPELRRIVYDYYTRRWIHASRVLVDKENLEPSAFPDEDYAGFVRTVRDIVPDVKLLFLNRDPIATVWSMMHRGWGNTLTSGEVRKYSLDECIRTWCASAELIREYSEQDAVLVCQHEDLVRHPETESARILDFLGINGDSTFEPRPTKDVGFTSAERNHITQATESLRETIHAL